MAYIPRGRGGGDRGGRGGGGRGAPRGGGRGGRVQLSIFSIKPKISHCPLQCVLLGIFGRFGGIANSSQVDLATVEVGAAHEVADEVVVHQGVEERQEGGVVEPEEV